MTVISAGCFIPGSQHSQTFVLVVWLDPFASAHVCTLNAEEQNEKFEICQLIFSRQRVDRLAPK